MKIFTATQIEDMNIGITRKEISCMIRAGYEPSHGTKMTVESVMQWKAENRHFRISHFAGRAPLSIKELRQLYGSGVRAVDKQKQAAGKLGQIVRRTNTVPVPPASPVGKSGEPSLTHG